MRVEEFNVLYAIHKDKVADVHKIGQKTGYDETKVLALLDGLKDKGWLADEITDQGYQMLEEYRVDNAIIMAAGFGLRSLPLSRIVPKGLYKVRDEVLIERQIEQLLQAGVSQIIVVVGYLKEKFAYLEEKYGVILVENNDYYRYNNISSLYVAREYLKNSYICCSDNYFNINVFEEYVYDSYYSCKYAEGYVDEYCVTKTDGEYIKEIHKGGSDAWYTIGEAFFSKSFSSKFLKFLEAEYAEKDTKKMLWDDFHIRHIDELPLKLVKYTDEIVQEFDTVEDIIVFDPEFEQYRKQILAELSQIQYNVPKAFEKYDDIERYDSATTDQHTGRLHLNENTFGPSPKCLEVLKRIQIQDLYEYDMASEDFLIKEISRTFSIPADDIYIHNGSAEVIKSIFSIVLERGDVVLVSNPGWSYYASLAKEKFCDVIEYSIKKDDYSYFMDTKELLEKAKEYHPKLIIITSPHNPTGCKIDGETLETIIQQNPDTLILLDEAYAGFAEEDIDIRRLVETYSNIIISRTFSKYYGLADIRIGYAFCNFKIKRIWGLDLPLFRTSTISRKMAACALHDKKYYEEMGQKLQEVKTFFADELNSIPGIRVFESYSNFVPVRIENADMTDLKEFLRENGILIRLFEDHGEILARIAIAELDVMKKTVELIRNYIERIYT